MTSFAVEVAPPLPHQRPGEIAPLVLTGDIVPLRGTASPEFAVTSYAALNSRQFRGFQGYTKLIVLGQGGPKSTAAAKQAA